MFNIFHKYNNNSILEEPKIKWNEIDNHILNYIKVDKENFEMLPILSQQLIIQQAVIDKELIEKEENINLNTTKNNENEETILLKNNQSFNDFLDNIEIYADKNFYKFIFILENLKKEKNILYKRIKNLETNIKNNKNKLKNVDRHDKRNILKYDINIKKYEDELHMKTIDYRNKKILYEILLEIKKTIKRKNI